MSDLPPPSFPPPPGAAFPSGPPPPDPYDENAPLERKRGLGLVIVAFVVVVALLGGAVAAFIAVVTADDSSAPSSSVLLTSAPVANQDHWHSAYAVSICGEFEPPFTSQDDPVGIHSHADGVIHIHPFFAEAAGDNATLGLFLHTMGASLTNDTLTLDDGRTFTEGEDTCDGEPAVVTVARWSDATLVDHTDPEVFTEDFDAIRFEDNLEAYTISFAPEGTEPEPPPSIPQLARLTDIPLPATPA